ncbi:MAG: discoidin domain-containing protein, partial [Bacilli bacterium]|nr:discoidin domain-containing protein [Bacilli bacterium]
DEEIESITAENGIYIHIVGVNYNEENVFKINILNQSTPTGIYNNDLENRVIGVTDYMEWRMPESDKWTLFKDGEPDLTGDKTVYVRARRHDVYLTSGELALEFTQDEVNDKRKYVSIDHLSIETFSTEATAQKRYAKHMIDGNIYTSWHSAWNGTDVSKYIVVKLDEPIYLSALEYLPLDGQNGKILNAEISGSLDGENFTPIVESTKWGNNATMKSVELEDSVRVQYIKVVGKETSSAGSLSFIAGIMFNFYEDITKRDLPTVEVEYSTVDATNQNVIAHLVNPSTEIIVTNNDGKDYYEFTENGTFTFEFEDKHGRKNTITAVVSNIDKTAPTATIKYDIPTLTNQNVTASLENISKPVSILNEDGLSSHVFTENGTYIFEIQDGLGNTNKIEAKVDWIDKTAPTAEIEYSTTSKTTAPVTATLKNASETIVILNNNGSNIHTFTSNGTFEFEYRDQAGNIGKTTATVNWITKNNTNNSGNSSTGNNTNSNQVKPNTNDKNNNNSNDNSSPNLDPSVGETSNETQEYNVGIITLTLPKGVLNDNVALKTRKLAISKDIQEKVGGQNEYFEPYFITDTFEVINITNTPMKMRIKLDSTKEFNGIYEIGNNNVINELKYEVVGNNEIEVEITDL